MSAERPRLLGSGAIGTDSIGIVSNNTLPSNVCTTHPWARLPPRHCDSPQVSEAEREIYRRRDSER